MTEPCRTRVSRQLSEKLSPVNASRAFQECWALDSAGKTKEALEVLKRVGKRMGILS